MGHPSLRVGVPRVSQPRQRPHAGAGGCDPDTGFPTDTRWLAITPHCTTTNIATDRASNSHSIFEFYRRLIALRHGSSERSLGGETLVVMGNFSATSLELPHLLAGGLVLGNLVIGNSGEMPDVATHGARGKCGWFGAGEIGPVRKQYQLGSFAGLEQGALSSVRQILPTGKIVRTPLPTSCRGAY